ncbi:MAG: hypothetical protein AAGU11_10310 [Syntrophobacteraceae bacterium]
MPSIKNRIRFRLASVTACTCFALIMVSLWIVPSHAASRAMTLRNRLYEIVAISSNTGQYSIEVFEIPAPASASKRLVLCSKAKRIPDNAGITLRIQIVKGLTNEEAWELVRSWPYGARLHLDQVEDLLGRSINTAAHPVVTITTEYW